MTSPVYIVLIALLLGHSEPAYAYLDPGSGSALISVITATIGSLWHTIKTGYYSLTGKKTAKHSYVSQTDSLVIFSEGKAYWGTFQPLIEELIKLKIPFRYLSLDVYDPALKIESKYMQSKRLSLNSFSLTGLRKIEAPVMISTMPNIGSKGYPIAKPKNIGNLIHIFHHVGDISVYKRNSLDHYDSVILAGNFQEKSIRKLERLRSLKPKKLVTLGLPYLDNLYLNRPSAKPVNTKRPTILIGSSWGEKGCLRTYGMHFIKELITAGFRLIIRPHPQSYISEPEFIANCKRETQGSDVRWDDDISPAKAMHESQLLISDTSSLRFDFAFLYERPIITLSIPKENLVEFEAADLDEHWHDVAATKIGIVVNKDTIKNISSLTNQLLKEHKATDLQSFRQQIVVNFGESSEHIIRYINELATHQEA